MTTDAEWKEIERTWNVALKVHKSVAQELGGGTVSCEKCKKSETVNVKSVADYLAWGWPLCCGQTMTFVPAHTTTNTTTPAK